MQKTTTTSRGVIGEVAKDEEEHEPLLPPILPNLHKDGLMTSPSVHFGDMCFDPYCPEHPLNGIDESTPIRQEDKQFVEYISGLLRGENPHGCEKAGCTDGLTLARSTAAAVLTVLAINCNFFKFLGFA